MIAAAVDCPLCDNTGWAPLEADGIRRVKRCDCWKALHPSGIIGVPAL